MNDKNSNLSHKDSEELLITSTSSSIINEPSENTTTASSKSEITNEVENFENKTKSCHSDDTESNIETSNVVVASSNVDSSFQEEESDNKEKNQKDCTEIELLEEQEKNKITIDSNIGSNDDVLIPRFPTMGGASSNNDAETCVLPKTGNYMERISENTKNLNFTRPKSSSPIGGSNITAATTTISVPITMSAPTTRSKRKLMNDSETPQTAVAPIATTAAATTTGTAAHQSRNNSISVNNKSIKLDIKDIKENVKNHQIQPQISVTTRRSAAAAAAAAANSMTTTAAITSATTSMTLSKTKPSINSMVGKKSDGNSSRNEDNQSIILMRSSSSTRKHLIDRDDGGGGSGKLLRKSNCINDLTTEEIEESQKDIKLATNTITKFSETKDENYFNSNKNPASSSCDIDDKQLNVGEIRKVEPLKINLNRDVIKPTKIIIKPIVKTSPSTLEDESKETSPPTSLIPKLTIKSTSSSSSLATASNLVASTISSNLVSELSCMESQHSVPMQQVVHSEAHVVPKLTIRTSDCANSMANSEVTHSVVPKLTIKMDSSSNCERDTFSSSTSSPSTSSPSPPPILPKLTIKTSSDMSEATILSSSCSSQQKSSTSIASSTVCHIVSGTSTMTSSLSSSQTSVPKLTIKTIQIPSSTASSSSSSSSSYESNPPTIPKLTIKSIPLPVESEDSIRTDDESLSETDSSSWQQQQVIIPKLTIRTGGQEPSVKIHQHESNISSSDNITNQSIPKLTIRTKTEQETGEKISSSVPKFTIKTVQETTQSIPKLTISVSDSMAPSSSSSSLSPLPEKIPKLMVRQVESDETERIPKLMISRQDDGEENSEKVPKITIKTIQEYAEPIEKIPKLTIKSLHEPSSENMTEKLPKLTIKHVVEPESTEKIPKITIKPLQEPEDVEKLPSFKVTISQSDSENFEKIPKLTIKQIQEDVDKVPKLTIRSVSNIEDNNSNRIPKIKIKQIQEENVTTIEKCPKLTIKGINEFENSEKLPKLMVRTKEMKDEIVEKIPKLTIKQIQDSEDRSKSPKLAVVFSTINKNDENVKKDCSLERNDFLDVTNPPKEGEEKNMNTSIENVQEKGIEIPKRDGKINETHHPPKDQIAEMGTIVSTDKISEIAEKNSKLLMNRKLTEREVQEVDSKESLIEKQVENNAREENIKMMQDNNFEIAHFGNLNPDKADNRNETPQIENIANFHHENIQLEDKQCIGNIENIKMSTSSMPIASSSSTISIESDDEKISEETSNSNFAMKTYEKAMEASFCSSLKEDDVVEALLAVLQQHYQDGSNSSSQVPNQNLMGLESNSITNKNIRACTTQNFDPVEGTSSYDDDVIIVNSDQQNNFRGMQIDQYNTSEHQEKYAFDFGSKSNEMMDMVATRDSDKEIDSQIVNETNNDTSTMASMNIFLEETQEKKFQKQDVIETVDLTLSPKNQSEERYQGSSLLGRLLSQPLGDDILSKRSSNIATPSPYDKTWPFSGGNMNMHAMSISNFGDRTNLESEKDKLAGYNIKSSNRNVICNTIETASSMYDSTVKIPTENKTVHSIGATVSTINESTQHSPATSLENLLNNISENSIDDVQYVSSANRTMEKDVETLENLEAFQPSHETLKILTNETSSKIACGSLNFKENENENMYSKTTNTIDVLGKDKNQEKETCTNEKLQEIAFGVNNNQNLEMISAVQQSDLSKDIHPFNNSLKRSSEESDSSDCIEIPVKKSRCELVDNTIPDSISLDSEAESIMIPSSDCSLNQPTKDAQSNLTENETSSTISDEHEIKVTETRSTDSEMVKTQRETTVDLKMLLARMQHTTSLERRHTPTDEVNDNTRRTPESIRPTIAIIQEGPVRHHSRKSKHSILRNDNEESGSDDLINNIADPLITTFTNSVYDRKNHEIDSGVDVSGSLQSETSAFQRQPLKRPRGRPRKDGLPAGSVKKLPRTMLSDIHISGGAGDTPSLKRKYKRRLLPAAESPTSQASSAPSDISKDSIPVLTPSLEVIQKRSDTPSALSSCSVPSPAIPYLTPEIPISNSSENTSPASAQPRTSSSSSFPTTPSPKETSTTLVDLTTSTITASTSTLEACLPLPKSLMTPKIPTSSRRGSRGGRSARGGRSRGGIIRNRPRCIGGLSHTPEIAREGLFFSPERRKIIDVKPLQLQQASTSSAPQVFEEDTRMSAESIVTPIRPTNRQSEIVNNDDTQSSVLSSTSIIDGNGSTTATTTTTTITPIITGSKKKVKSKMEVTAPEGKTEYTVDMIAEYDWPPPKGCCPAKNRDTFMIQEQIAQYLGIKSFKRKYPDLPRRQIDMEERNWLQEKGLVTEKMCDLGITAVWASDVLDIMYSDFYDKYEEYKTYIRQKHLRDVEAKQKALAAEAVDRTLQARDRALQSAAKWNSNFNRTRKEDRRLCLDLQNLTINIPQSVAEKLSRPIEIEQRQQPPSNYPIALVPGQFSEHYRHYTPEELRQYPINTVLELPENLVERIQPKCEPDPEEHKSDSESESNDSSSSDSENSESDSNSEEDTDFDSNSSSDNEDDPPDEMKCFVCHQAQNKNLHGFPEVFVRCYTCRRQIHPSCIEMPHHMANRVKNYNWQCAECKCCIKCKRKTDESKMIYCEQCDRGYHIYCVRIKSVPEGRWHCEHCAICMRCGTNKPEGNVPLPPAPPNSKWKPKRKWIHEYRVDPVTKLREHISILCAPCARLKRNPKPPS